ISECDGFANERAEFQLVLDKLWCERRTVLKFADVLGAIDDGELPLRIDQAGVTGLEPAIHGDRLSRGVLLLVVPEEHSRPSQVDLTVLVDPDFPARRHLPDRVRISVPVALEHDESAGFGRAIDLLEIDAERPEESEGVGPERSASAQAPARISEPQLIAYWSINQDLAKSMCNIAHEGDFLAVGPQQLTLLGRAPEKFVDEPLEPGRVGGLDLHLR